MTEHCSLPLFVPKRHFTLLQAIELVARVLKGEGIVDLGECQPATSTDLQTNAGQLDEFHLTAIRLIREELYEGSLIAVGYNQYFELSPFESSYFAVDFDVERLLEPACLEGGGLDPDCIAFIFREDLLKRLPVMLAERERSIRILDGNAVSPYLWAMIRASAELDVRMENRVPKDEVERVFRKICTVEGIKVTDKVVGYAAQMIRWPQHGAGGNFPMPERVAQ